MRQVAWKVVGLLGSPSMQTYTVNLYLTKYLFIATATAMEK